MVSHEWQSDDWLNWVISTYYFGYEGDICWWIANILKNLSVNFFKLGSANNFILCVSWVC